MQLRFLFVVLAATVLTVGCELTHVPESPKLGDNQTTISEVAPPEVVFRKLANAVSKGTIETRYELSQYVKSLVETGDLPESAQAAFDAHFKGATTDRSPINKDADSQTLRQIKLN